MGHGFKLTVPPSWIKSPKNEWHLSTQERHLAGKTKPSCTKPVINDIPMSQVQKICVIQSILVGGSEVILECGFILLVLFWQVAHP